MWEFVALAACLLGGTILLGGTAIALMMVLYALPYGAWLGWNMGTKGIPKDAGKRSSLLKQVKNATKLYRSWITHTPHGITDW